METVTSKSEQPCLCGSPHGQAEGNKLRALNTNIVQVYVVAFMLLVKILSYISETVSIVMLDYAKVRGCTIIKHAILARRKIKMIAASIRLL